MSLYIDILPLFLLLISNFVCTLLCVLYKNPIIYVLYLMISFVILSALLLYLGAQFISLLVLFIYVGAISILLIFVLMILDLKALFFDNSSIYFYNILFVLLAFFIILYFVADTSIFFSIIYKNSDWNAVDFTSILYMQSDIRILGFVLYNFYFYHFFLVSLILLFVLVGSISIVIERKNVLKKQNYKNQVKSFIGTVH
jgi:NADH-quinone oxidoreductase subunit J